MNLDEVKAQYLEMSYQDLLRVKKDAVLTPNVKEILDAVLRAKKISDTGLVECEFCKNKIKSEITYCKYCGIKLRG